MTERVWIGEAAENLGVSLSGIKAWCDRLGLANERDNRGRRVLSPNELEVLTLAKAMREDGRTFDTITKRVGRSPDNRQAADTQDPESADDRQATVRQSSGGDYKALISEVLEAVSYQIDQKTDLAEKYARAAHQIGKLEADNEYLRSEVSKLQSQMAEAQLRLSAADSEATENTRLKEQLEQQSQKLAAIEKENVQLKARPWWRIWS